MNYNAKDLIVKEGNLFAGTVQISNTGLKDQNDINNLVRDQKDEVCNMEDGDNDLEMTLLFSSAGDIEKGSAPIELSMSCMSSPVGVLLAIWTLEQEEEARAFAEAAAQAINAELNIQVDATIIVTI